MTASLPLGTGPRDEPPPTDEGEAFRACRAYRLAFRMLLGDEPDGACLRVIRSDDDAPFHLICEFDPNDPEAARYAAACGRTEIDTWAAAGLTDPIRRGTGSGQGR